MHEFLVPLTHNIVVKKRTGDYQSWKSYVCYTKQTKNQCAKTYPEFAVSEKFSLLACRKHCKMFWSTKKEGKK